jgi:hypothetical protein
MVFERAGTVSSRYGFRTEGTVSSREAAKE